MTRKPTTKSPEERRLRKHIRELLQVYAADTSRLNTDATVREFLNLIDDEVRRTRMSIAPAVQEDKQSSLSKSWKIIKARRDFSGTGFGKPRADVTKPFFWTTEDEPGPMTDAEWKERTQIKKALYAAALDGTFTCGGK